MTSFFDDLIVNDLISWPHPVGLAAVTNCLWALSAGPPGRVLLGIVACQNSHACCWLGDGDWVTGMYQKHQASRGCIVILVVSNNLSEMLWYLLSWCVLTSFWRFCPPEDFCWCTQSSLLILPNGMVPKSIVFWHDFWYHFWRLSYTDYEKTGKT